MAGTPPADIIYALAFARVLFKLNSCLIDKGLHSILDAHRFAPSLAVSDADYCDDTVFLVVALAPALVDKATDVACYAHVTFNSYGLSINYDNGKTSVVQYFAGDGAIGARRKLYLNGNVSSSTVNSKCFTLIFVSHYTHVDTKFSISNDLRHEVSPRAAIIRTGPGAVRKIIADPVSD